MYGNLLREIRVVSSAREAIDRTAHVYVLAEHKVEDHAEGPDVTAHAHLLVTDCGIGAVAAINSLAHHLGGQPLQCAEVIVPLFGVVLRGGDSNALECLAGAKVGDETGDARWLIAACTVAAGRGVQQDVLRLEVVVDHVARVHAVQTQQHVQED